MSRYSAMLKPAVLRSMCTQHVSVFGGSDASGCPKFDLVFVRNLNTLTVTRDSNKYACAMQQVDDEHPCMELNAHACRASFTTALQG